MKFLNFLLCFFKMTLALAPQHIDYFVIRHVGQGQWVTHVLNQTCEHFDFGGESQFYAHLKARFHQQCFAKKNILHLSHADWDHYAFMDLILKNSLQTCWGTKSVDSLATSIPLCSQAHSSVLFYDSRGRDKNDRSIVQLTQGFLLPGDSSQRMEKIWSRHIFSQPVKYIILGHHGSKTSTGLTLLQKIPSIKLAIASARFKKYHHPCEETRQRLKYFHIPMIRTEDWGNLIIY